MKTMTMYELLGMVKDGKAPKKIKINNVVYEYRGYMYCTEKANYQDIEDYLFGKWNFNILNDEVEILEEEHKIPEKLDYKYENIYHNISKCKHSEIRIIDKINEIIDYLKSKGE